MRVLIVSPYPVMPALHGGRVRTLGIATGLARAGAEVTVLCPWVPGNPRLAHPEARLECRSHLFLANLLPAVGRWVAPPLALLSFQPRAVGPRRALRALGDVDVCQFEFCAQARWMRLAPHALKRVYSAHNVEQDFHAADRDRYLLRKSAGRRIARLERSAVRDSDLVLTCSAADAERLREIYGAPRLSTVVPNGFDAAALGGADGARERSRAALGLEPGDRAIVFVGGDASHNREAVEFLIRRALPGLGERDRLLVAGRCLRAGAARDPRVRRLGFVADLGALLAAADVAVNPVAFGSGSNVKLAEYLAAGLPVLTTPIGLRGFGDRHSPGVIVAEREEFAAALRRAIPRPERDPRLLAELSWDAIGKRLLGIYEDLLRPRE